MNKKIWLLILSLCLVVFCTATAMAAENDCEHKWNAATGKCIKCDAEHAHTYVNDEHTGKCDECGFAHIHADYSPAGVEQHTCDVCHKALNHNFDATGYCATCEYQCGQLHDNDHYWVSTGEDAGKCQYCGVKCQHKYWTNGLCDTCNMAHDCEKVKNFKDGKCQTCEKNCAHLAIPDTWDKWDKGACTVCGAAHKHTPTTSTWSKQNGKYVCTACDYVCTHKWEYDDAGVASCTKCPQKCGDGTPVDDIEGSANKHNLKLKTLYIAGSCTQKYIRDMECTKCGYVVRQSDYDHKYVKGYKAATCTSYLQYGDICSNCGKTNNMVDATDVPGALVYANHTIVIDKDYVIPGTTTKPYKAPTCKDFGYGYKYCSVCTGKVFNNAQTYPGHCEAIDKLVHQYVTTILPADCLNNERTADVCKLCKDAINVKDVPGGEQKKGSHELYTEWVAPTCKKDGGLIEKCSNCGHTRTITVATAATAKDQGHNYVVDKVLREGDCTTNRIVVEKCNICNNADVSRVVVKPVNHNWKYNDDYVPATCGEAAKGTKTCAVCGVRKSVADATDAENYEPATGKHLYKENFVVPATCTDPEMKGHCCIYCHKLYDATKQLEKVAGSEALGHDWVYDYNRVDDNGNKIYKAETCTKPGKVYVHKCKRCDAEGTKGVVIELKPLGHTKPVYSYVEATCTTPAGYGPVCTRCEEAIGDVTYIDGAKELGHDYRSVRVEPTCQKDGYTGIECVRCHDVQNATVIPHDGTMHVMKVDKVLRKATCTVAGVEIIKCKEGCANTQQVRVIKASHTWGEGTVITPATCSKAGKGTHTCLVATCGKTEEYEIAATGNHNFVAGQIKPATCTEGEKYGTFCTVCWANKNGDAQELGTKPAGHKYAYNYDKKDAKGSLIYIKETCTTAGQVWQECSVCHADGKIISLKAKGHTWGDTMKNEAGTVEYHVCTVCQEREITKVNGEYNKEDLCDTYGHTLKVLPAVAATCTKTGLTEGAQCTVCNKITVEQKEVPVIAHTEETIPAVAATCTKTGLAEGKKCTVCGKVTVEQKVVEVLPHTFAEGVCTVCGAKDPDFVPHVHKYTKKYSFNADFTKRVVTSTCECGHTVVEEEDF